MAHDLEHARDLANEVLSRIRADGGPAWKVLDVVQTEEVAPPPTDPGGVFHIRITIGAGISDPETVAVYFTVGVPPEDAIVATAGQIQDHAIEATHGMALPACPGHTHPQQATMLDGEPRWVCPRDPSHHSEPIVRAHTG